MSEERGPAFNPDAGEHVESAARRLQAMARERNEEVFCLFNDTRMAARPGMSIDAILAGWRNGRRRTNETTPDAVEQALSDLESELYAAPLSEDDVHLPARALEVLCSAVAAERARHAEEVAELRACSASEHEHLDELRDVTIPALSRSIQGLEAENTSLRDQLRRVEGERDALKLHYEEALECETESFREQLRKVEGEREEALRMVDGIRKSEKTARESMVINMRLRDEAQAENVQLKAERDALRSLLPDVRACAEYCENRSCPFEPGPVGIAARNILAALDSPECPECHRNSDHKMSCSRGGSKGGRFGVSLDSQGGEEPSLPGEPPNGNAGPARKDKSCSK